MQHCYIPTLSCFGNAEVNVFILLSLKLLICIKSDFRFIEILDLTVSTESCSIFLVDFFCSATSLICSNSLSFSSSRIKLYAYL